jgi:hypothetical protein
VFGDRSFWGQWRDPTKTCYFDILLAFAGGSFNISHKINKIRRKNFTLAPFYGSKIHYLRKSFILFLRQPHLLKNVIVVEETSCIIKDIGVGIIQICPFLTFTNL